MSVWIAVAVALAVAGAALAWWLIRRRRVILDDDAGAMAIAARLPGFMPVAALIGEDRRHALVRSGNGRLAVVGVRGPREIAWAEVRATPGGMLVEPTGALVTGINALDIATFRRV